MKHSTKIHQPQHSNSPLLTSLLIFASIVSYLLLFKANRDLDSIIHHICPDHLHVYSFGKEPHVYTNADHRFSNTQYAKMASNLKWAQGFVVDEHTGRFVHVAKDRDELVQKFGKCKKWTEFERDEYMVMPSFIDAHLHIILGGQSLLGAPLQNVQSRAEFEKLLKDYARVGYGQHEPWITGGYWSESTWGGEPPTKEWVDHVDKPAILMRQDGHSALVNSLALAHANITKDTPDPQGGTIVRDAKGEPTGLLKDKAIEVVYGSVPPLNEDKALDVAGEHMVRFGITTVHHMGALGKVGGSLSELKTYKKAELENRLKFRIYTSLELKNMHQLTEWIDEHGMGSDFLKVGMLKEFFDGSLGSRTSLQYSADENVPDAVPYVDSDTSTGLQVHDDDELLAYLKQAEEMDFQVAIHAIGEKANDKLLDMYAEVFANKPDKDRRWRVEHAQQTRPQTRSRYAELGVSVCVNPTHLLFDSAYAERFVGKKGTHHLYAFKDLFDASEKTGKPLVAAGSDWFVSPINPLLAVDAAVNRVTETHPDGFGNEHKISIEQAIEAFTIAGAYASFSEHDLGQIKEGFLADFVVLNKNLFEVDPTEIKNVVVKQTYCHGRKVYERDDDSQVRTNMSGENTTDLDTRSEL